jgi:hypothetical protein
MLPSSLFSFIDIEHPIDMGRIATGLRVLVERSADKLKKDAARGQPALTSG